MKMKQGYTEIRAAAEILKNAKKLIYNPPIADIYDLAKESVNVVVSDVEIPAIAMKKLGFKENQNKVIVSYSGQDAGRSAWARRLVHEADESTRDNYARIVREVNMKLLTRELLCTESYIGDQQNKPIISNLPRLIMLFDSDGNTAYLLGARYFGEVKKATLTLAWKAVVTSGLGCSIHGSSKLLHIKTPKGEKDVVFLTIGLSGSGKSTIGLSIHEGHMRDGEYVKVANDDAVAIIFNENVTVGFEEGCFNKTDDYVPGSYMLETLVTAENVLVYRDSNNRIGLIHEDVFVGNGRCITYRPALRGASEDVNVPWPNYITLIMKEETLPPIMLVKDPILIASLFMSLSTKPSAAENIPIEEMGKLKIIPGANPFIIYPMQQEADTVTKMIKTTGCKGLIFNTSDFYVDTKKRIKIPKELTLSLYPKVARDEIQWEEYRPGFFLPKFDEEYEKKFDPRHVLDQEGYKKLFNDRMDQRIAFLRKIGLSEDYQKALEKLKHN